MDFVEEVLVDFCLFNFWEAIVCGWFFYRICGLEKFKWWQYMLFGFATATISLSFKPVIYQFVMIAFTSLFVLFLDKKKENILNYLIKTVKMVGMMLVLDMCFCNMLEINGVDMFHGEKLQIFLYFIIVKVFEVLLIEGWYKGMKKGFWIGKLSKPSKPARK